MLVTLSLMIVSGVLICSTTVAGGGTVTATLPATGGTLALRPRYGIYTWSSTAGSSVNLTQVAANGMVLTTDIVSGFGSGQRYLCELSVIGQGPVSGNTFPSVFLSTTGLTIHRKVPVFACSYSGHLW